MQILLEFEGIATHANIYFNGTIVKRNFSGYNSFSIDITDFAKFGLDPNILTVQVKADKWEGWWYEGAGIYRNVWLVKKPSIHTAYNGVWVKPQRLNLCDWQVDVETTVENSFEEAAEYVLETTIVDADGAVIAQGECIDQLEGHQKKVKKQQFIVKKPVLWDVKAPNLYYLRTKVVKGKQTDEVETRFGFRTVQVDVENGFVLNDKPIKLKGVCCHQDHAGVGAAVPYGVEEYRIQKLKEMGCNAYRTAHGAPSSTILDLCDEYGLIVMDENRNFNSADVGKELLEEQLMRDRNHPSVCIYSLFNEEPLQGTAVGRRIGSHLRDFARRLDDTRPFLGAMNGGFMNEEGCCDVLDITGFNYFMDSYDEFHEKFPNQPVIGSETNSAFTTRGEYTTNVEQCVFDNYDEKHAPWGASVRETWKTVQERDFVLGMFAWTGFDYRGEPSPCEWPSISSHFGIMDTCGFPKDIFYLYQAYWLEQTILHILPHWNHEGMEGKNIRVMTFSNCEEIELFLNEESLGIQKNELYKQCSWMVPYCPGKLEAVGYIKGRAVMHDVVRTAGAPARIIMQCAKKSIAADGTDVAVIDVHVEDEQGITVPQADNWIQFVCSGGGHITGVGNGDPNCHEKDKAEARSLFHGWCQVIVQSNGLCEKTIVQAKALGLETVGLVLQPEQGVFYPSVEPSCDMVVGGWRVSHEASEERPEITPLAVYDMNTFEPVTFDGKESAQLEGKYGYYLQYKTRVSAKQLNKTGTMFFHKVTGHVWVYFNGVLAGERDCPLGGSVKVPIEKAQEDLDVAVLVQCSDKDIPYGGIAQAVSIIYE